MAAFITSRLLNLSAVIALLLFGSALSASAQVIRTVDLDQPIQPGSTVTYRDAVKLALPEQNADGSIISTAHVRDGWKVNDATVYRGKLNIVTMEAAWLRSRELRGQKRLVMFIKLEGQSDNTLPWGELCLLAVFETKPKHALTDLVDVGGNRVTSLLGLARFHAGEDGIVIGYEYRKVDEEYQHVDFLRIDHGQVGELFTGFPFTYYGQRGDREVSQAGNYTSKRVARSQYRDLVFDYSFSLNKYLAEGNDVTPIRSRNFRLRAVWRHGRYQFADGGAELRRLNKERKFVAFD